MEAKGKCLCGAVQVSAKNMSTDVGACHCSMCRRWSSGPLMAADCGTEVLFTGEENISVYESSEWADRGFCKKCGSNLFYRLKQKGTTQYVMSIGLFDHIKECSFSHQVFIEEKPALYSFANKTIDMTGAELFAKFTPPSA